VYILFIGVVTPAYLTIYWGGHHIYFDFWGGHPAFLHSSARLPGPFLVFLCSYHRRPRAVPYAEDGIVFTQPVPTHDSSTLLAETAQQRQTGSYMQQHQTRSNTQQRPVGSAATIMVWPGHQGTQTAPCVHRTERGLFATPRTLQ